MGFLRKKSIRLPCDPASVIWGLAAMGCLLAAGCNQGKQLHGDIIARELRLQEDEIYRLEDYLEEYQRKVCTLRAEKRQLQEQLGAALATSTNPSAKASDEDDKDDEGDLPVDNDFPRRSAGDVEGSDEGSDEDEPSTDVPVIDFGTPIDAPPPAPVGSGEAPPAESPAIPGGEAPRFESLPPEAETLPTGEPTLPEELDSPAPVFQPLSFEVTSSAEPLAPILRELPIVHEEPLLLPALQRVAIFNQPGPPEPNGQLTLAIRVTPLFVDDATAVFTGEVSLLLRDPQATGSAATVARWDYTAAEVASHAEASSNRSLQFLVGLPDEVFADRSLELWVRLVDERGNKTLGVVPAVLSQQLEPLRSPALSALPAVGLVRQASWEEPATTPPTLSLPPAPSEAAKPTESTLRIILDGDPANAPDAAPAAAQPAGGWRKSRDAEAPRLLEPVVLFGP